MVLDASALFELVAGGEAFDDVARLVRRDDDLAAPHVIDVEVLGVIRQRHLVARDLDATAAAMAVDLLRRWPGQRVAHGPLLGRAWQLRHTVRGWDAMYVALADVLGATLVTRDRRLAGAPGPRCAIEVVSLAPPGAQTR